MRSHSINNWIMQEKMMTRWLLLEIDLMLERIVLKSGVKELVFLLEKRGLLLESVS